MSGYRTLDPWRNYDNWKCTPPEEPEPCPCDEEGRCPSPGEEGKYSLKCERCGDTGLICPVDCKCDGDDATHWCPECDAGAHPEECLCVCHDHDPPDWREREDW